MRRVIFVLSVALAALLFIGTMPSASAQALCGKHGDILVKFADAYGEVPGALAITDQGGLLEVLVSPTGTWTMLLTMPGQLTCVVGTGQAWQTRPLDAPRPGV
ncbi:MAG: hypothetical protein ACREEE_03450 [Dongiaceae bacterium]